MFKNPTSNPSKKESYSYDVFGNQKKRNNRGSSSYGYNRMSRESGPNKQDNNEDSDYEYDEDQNIADDKEQEMDL